jgi:hypothetical protein
MSGHGLAGPIGACFIGGVVANREDKVEVGRTGGCEFVPEFAAQTLDAEAG